MTLTTTPDVKNTFAKPLTSRTELIHFFGFRFIGIRLNTTPIIFTQLSFQCKLFYLYAFKIKVKQSRCLLLFFLLKNNVIKIGTIQNLKVHGVPRIYFWYQIYI